MEQTAFALKETAFHELMSRRIREILLVCSHYDKFMLDEDGRIEEQLFQEGIRAVKLLDGQDVKPVGGSQTPSTLSGNSTAPRLAFL